ncbi:MAG: hypothetical protein V1723_02455 [Candidatus Uhrbacteria bacterium]
MTRFFRALFYYLSGQFIWGARSLEKNPHVIEARFDHALGKLGDNLRVVKDQVGSILGLRERRKMDLGRLQEQKAEHEDTMDGAEALAQDRVTKLRAEGRSDADIEADAEYRQYSAAYADAESTLGAVNADIARCEEDIARYDQQGKDYVIQLQQMQREIEKIKREKHETLADVSIAAMEGDIQDALSGFATDGVGKELDALRDIRMKARGDAEVSRTLAGSDAKVQGAKLRAAAHAARATSRLSEKFGLHAKAEVAAAPAASVAPKMEVPAAVGGGGKGGSLPG